MPELQFLKTLIIPRALYKLQNWVNFSLFSYLIFFLSSLLMVVPSSLVNIERLKDGNVEMDTHVNIYVRNEVHC